MTTLCSDRYHFGGPRATCPETNAVYAVEAENLDTNLALRTGFLGAYQDVHGARSASEAIRLALPAIRTIVGDLGPIPLGITATERTR